MDRTMAKSRPKNSKSGASAAARAAAKDTGAKLSLSAQLQRYRSQKKGAVVQDTGNRFGALGALATGSPSESSASAASSSPTSTASPSEGAGSAAGAGATEGNGRKKLPTLLELVRAGADGGDNNPVGKVSMGSNGAASPTAASA